MLPQSREQWQHSLQHLLSIERKPRAQVLCSGEKRKNPGACVNDTEVS